MKKITLLGLLFMTMIGYSQDVTTSVDEYKYMERGYWESIEKGTDLKKGYKVEDLGKSDFQFYSFEYKALLKEDDNKYVGIIVNAYSKSNNMTYHFAMPFNNKELMNNYVENITSWDKSMLDSYIRSITPMSAALFSKSLNK